MGDGVEEEGEMCGCGDGRGCAIVWTLITGVGVALSLSLSYRARLLEMVEDSPNAFLSLVNVNMCGFFQL